MTPEKAIEILEDLWRYEKVKYTDKEVRDAIDLAVEALKGNCAKAIEMAFDEAISELSGEASAASKRLIPMQPYSTSLHAAARILQVTKRLRLQQINGEMEGET